MKTKNYITGSLALSLLFCFAILKGQSQTCPNIPFFSQKDTSWANERLGCCSQSIKQAGCAISSASMVLKYYDYSSKINPSTLNAWLTSNNGYAGCCDTFWARAASYTKKTYLEAIQDTTSLSLLGQYVDKKPVIIKVVNPSTNNPHFVVALYRYSGKYYILDPTNTSSGAVTLDKYNNKIYKIIVYAKTPSAPSRQANIAATWAELKIQ